MSTKTEYELKGNVPFVPISLTHSFSHQSLKSMASVHVKKTIPLVYHKRANHKIDYIKNAIRCINFKQVNKQCWKDKRINNSFLPECLVITSFLTFADETDGAGDEDRDLSAGLPRTDFCLFNSPDVLPLLGVFLDPKLPSLASWGKSDLHSQKIQSIHSQFIHQNMGHAERMNLKPTTGHVTIKFEFECSSLKVK